MQFKFQLILMATLFASCGQASKQEDQKPTALPITGTWELISATTTQKDSTFSTFEPKNRMIKIISPTHFAFFNHDRSMGKDSATAAFSSGGGKYTLKDSTYTEYLEFCNFREWEDHTFPFTISVKNDTLTQYGVEKVENLGIERLIVEKYKREKSQ